MAVAGALCADYCGPAGVHHAASHAADATIAVDALVTLGWAKITVLDDVVVIPARGAIGHIQRAVTRWLYRAREPI